MKIRKIYIAWALLVSVVSITSSCTKKFGEINTNPSIVTKPDVGFLLTYAEDQIMKYQYTEWIWESMEQLLRFTQHETPDPYELTRNVNSRYNTYSHQILPNLVELSNQISAQANRATFLNMIAVTSVCQVLHGLNVQELTRNLISHQAVHIKSTPF